MKGVNLPRFDVEILVLIPMPVVRRDEVVFLQGHVFELSRVVGGLDLEDAVAAFGEGPVGCAAAVPLDYWRVMGGLVSLSVLGFWRGRERIGEVGRCVRSFWFAVMERLNCGVIVKVYQKEGFQLLEVRN